jgi:hypothetical protein
LAGKRSFTKGSHCSSRHCLTSSAPEVPCPTRLPTDHRRLHAGSVVNLTTTRVLDLVPVVMVPSFLLRAVLATAAADVVPGAPPARSAVVVPTRSRTARELRRRVAERGDAHQLDPQRPNAIE